MRLVPQTLYPENYVLKIHYTNNQIILMCVLAALLINHIFAKIIMLQTLSFKIKSVFHRNFVSLDLKEESSVILNSALMTTTAIISASMDTAVKIPPVQLILYPSQTNAKATPVKLTLIAPLTTVSNTVWMGSALDFLIVGLTRVSIMETNAYLISAGLIKNAQSLSMALRCIALIFIALQNRIVPKLMSLSYKAQI